MGLSKKSRGKLSANHKILLRELEDLAVEDKPPLPMRESGVPELKTGLTQPQKKKAGRPKGPAFINTARLLTG